MYVISGNDETAGGSDIIRSKRGKVNPSPHPSNRPSSLSPISFLLLLESLQMASIQPVSSFDRRTNVCCMHSTNQHLVASNSKNGRYARQKVTHRRDDDKRKKTIFNDVRCDMILWPVAAFALTYPIGIYEIISIA